MTGSNDSAAELKAPEAPKDVAPESDACAQVRHRLWWLPNALTLARIGLAPVILGVLVAGAATNLGGHLAALTSRWTLAAAGLLVLAGVMDFLDGHLARRWGVQSAFGQRWDPIADKLVVGAGLVGLSLALPLIWPATLAVMSRDAFVTWLRHSAAHRTVIQAPSRLAKWKTAAEFAGLILVTGHWAIGIVLNGIWPVGDVRAGAGALSVWLGVGGLYTAAGLSLWTGAHYARTALRLT